MPRYFINQDQTKNPGWHHEVHVENGCHVGDLIPSNKRVPLGYHTDEVAAVQAALAYYSDADGCIHCCPRAHKG